MENFLQFMWIFASFLVAILGVNVLYNEKIMPEFITRIYNFGKTTKHLLKKNSFVRYFEIPKSWFLHFYVFACIYFFLVVLEIVRRYYLGSSTEFVTYILDIATSKNRKSSIPPESAFVLGILLTLHAARRSYECLYVSVYSGGKMNVAHYLFAIAFYSGVGLSLISEAPGFESHSSVLDVTFSKFFFSPSRFVGVTIFCLASAMQHHINRALAALRKDNKGKKVVTFKHVMPNGGWFEYISCPHFLAEILLYFSANLIMDGKNYTWWLVCLFVLTNQIIIGLANHQWYRKTFKNYPRSRKAVIPYLL